MYYRLNASLLTASTGLQDVSHPGIHLTTGQLLPANTPTPFEFTVEVDEAEEFEEQPEEPISREAINQVMDDYYPNVSVMHTDLVKLLKEAGVDNLQVFPAAIRPDYDEIEMEVADDIQITGYVVVNVLGVVACAALGESEYDDLGDSHYFHKLVIDPSRASDQLLFRLAEYPPQIIVHERVARKLLERGFKGLELEELECSSS